MNGIAQYSIEIPENNGEPAVVQSSKKGSLELPQLVSPEVVAKYLDVSPYTVRERLKSGELPGRKHGSRWLIRVVDLVNYVEPNNVR